MKTILVDAVNTFVIEGEGVYKPLHDLLEQFPNRKIIVSNANDEELIPFGLIDLPYELFTLKHNPNKTDPSYFKKLLAHFNLKESDVIYFEHNSEAVKSAQSLGITSYYYNHTEKNTELLKDFLTHNLQ